jgi:hypothetical protein
VCTESSSPQTPGFKKSAYAIDIVGMLLNIEKSLHVAHVDFHFMRTPFVHVDLKIGFTRVDALVRPLQSLVEEYEASGYQTFVEVRCLSSISPQDFLFKGKVAGRVIPSTKMPLGNSEFDMPGLLETTTSINRAELVMKLDRSMGSRVLPLTIGVEFSDPTSPVSKPIACGPSQGARRLTC